jgi:hypothetical protein
VPTIDIELPDSLREALEVPRCIDLSLPEPATLSISLPTGGTLPAIGDFTRGIPDDCSLAFNLLAQVGPLLGNLDCIIKMLQLVEPLVNVVTGLTKVPPDPPAEDILKLAQALPPALNCIAKLLVPPLGLAQFLRDILLLIARLLRCIIGQLETVAGLLSGLALRIDVAAGAGNAELVASLECARDNAARSGATVMAAIEPLAAILALAKPLASFAGVELDVDLSGLGSPESAAQIVTIIETLEPVAVALEAAAEALGGG